MALCLITTNIFIGLSVLNLSDQFQPCLFGHCIMARTYTASNIHINLSVLNLNPIKSTMTYLALGNATQLHHHKYCHQIVCPQSVSDQHQPPSIQHCEMSRTDTTTNISIQLCVHNRRPSNPNHALLGICKWLISTPQLIFSASCLSTTAVRSTTTMTIEHWEMSPTYTTTIFALCFYSQPPPNQPHP